MNKIILIRNIQENTIRYTLFLLSVSVSLALLFCHVLWFNESQAVMIAYSSHGIGELFSYSGYEGTPMLWHLILYILKPFFLPQVDIKVVTAIVDILTLYLLYFKVNINKYAAFLFSIGPQLFIYSIISRPYTMSVLFILLFYYYENMWRNTKSIYSNIMLCITLFLLAQLSIDSLFIVTGIVMYLGLFNILKYRNISWFPIVLSIISAILVVIEVIPPHDLGAMSGWDMTNFLLRFNNTIVMILSTIAIPSLRTSVLDIIVKALIMLYPLIIILLLFYNKICTKIKVFVISIMTIVFLFSAVSVTKTTITIDQYYLLAVFIVSIILLDYRNKYTKAIGLTYLLIGAILTMLTYQLFLIPYSSSYYMAYWLSQKYPTYVKSDSIATYPDQLGTSISLYLDNTNGLYQVTQGKYMSHILWNKREVWPNYLNKREVQLPNKLPNNHSSYLLLTYFNPPIRFEGVSYKLVATIPMGLDGYLIYNAENIYVYKIN